MASSSQEPATSRGGANRPTRSRGTAYGGTRGRSAGEMKLYTEDMPGIQVGPSTVLIISLVYIGVVVLLHIISKIKS